MGVRTRLSMVDGTDDKAVPYENFKTGFGSPGNIKRVGYLIYISDTDMKKGHQ